MKRAGCGAFEVFKELWPQCRSIVVLCGSGNNGGDGYIFAEQARRAGHDVEVRCSNEPKTPEAQMACKAYKGSPVAKSLDKDCSEFDAVIDALLGIGLNKDVEGLLADAIKVVNDTAMRVMSLDVPTGVNSDTGELAGSAIKADSTVTFISPKIGLFNLPASEYVGQLFIDTLDVPHEAYPKVGNFASLVDPREFGRALPRRKNHAHKTAVGKVLIVGGSESMEGAALMAGRAAFRAGAGMVSIATITEDSAMFSHQSPEIRVHRLNTVADLEILLEAHDVVGVGPGLGQSDKARDVFSTLAASGKNLVVDADGLNILATTGLSNDNWILTPHLGEAARLLHSKSRLIETDRLKTSSDIVDQYGGVCVLKGQNTVIASKKAKWICDRGNSGMATAGMGDILTGVICGLWAPGMDMDAAARAGVWLHAVSGDDSAAENGPIGMTATDLLPAIRRNLNRVLDDTFSR